MDVAPEPTPYCRQCWNCRNGRHSRCERVGNFQSTGGYAEYAVLPNSVVHDLPDGLSLADAAMGEPAAVCLVGLERCMTPGGSNMVVIGGGLIGQLTLAFAKARGIGVSILSDPVEARREQALRLGADFVHDPAAGPLREVVAEVTAGRGIDLAVEAVGKPELVDLAIQVARPRGEVLILGVSPKGTTIPSDLFETHYKELIIVNSFGRGRRVHQGYQFAGGDRPDGSDGRPISAASGGGRDDGRGRRDIEVGKDCDSAPHALIFLLPPPARPLRKGQHHSEPKGARH